MMQKASCTVQRLGLYVLDVVALAIYSKFVTQRVPALWPRGIPYVTSEQSSLRAWARQMSHPKRLDSNHLIEEWIQKTEDRRAGGSCSNHCQRWRRAIKAVQRRCSFSGATPAGTLYQWYMGAENLEASPSKEMVKRHQWHPSDRSMITRLL
jgi:hypothetical protein